MVKIKWDKAESLGYKIAHDQILNNPKVKSWELILIFDH